VHANEWVASAPLLRHPVARRHIDYLENMQRGLTPRFDTATIAGAAMGFKNGGFSTPTSTGNAPAQQVTVVQQSDPELKSLLRHLVEEGVRSQINANEVFRAKGYYDSAVNASEY
jgi:hypothetical protein